MMTNFYKKRTNLGQFVCLGNLFYPAILDGRLDVLKDLLGDQKAHVVLVSEITELFIGILDCHLSNLFPAAELVV